MNNREDVIGNEKQYEPDEVVCNSIQISEVSLYSEIVLGYENQTTR
jgi:hypothetical protein